jgi:hypothetical protein
MSRKRILGHKYYKRLESFAPCYSQSFNAGLTTHTKKIWGTRKLESVYEKHFRRENKGRKPGKNGHEFMPIDLD